jgi:MoxR-like ATPase
MGYPDKEQELTIIRNRKNTNPMSSIEPLPDPKMIIACKNVAENVFVSESVEKYIIDLVAATRVRPEFELGASPRASLALMKMSRAFALMSHRDYVRPEDVAALYLSTVCHRVVLSNGANAAGIKAADVLQNILSTTAVPFVSGSRSK